jgi:hypothetical protein
MRHRLTTADGSAIRRPSPEQRTHAARTHRHDLVVETRETPLIVGDQFRIEGSLTVARNPETAAINSDGTIATTLAGSFINPATTSRLSLGEYQVGFKGPCGNVQSINGWFRIAQPDTLTGGATGSRYCTVADRVGNAAGVFIECFNGAGAFADTSFTLSVSR